MKRRLLLLFAVASIAAFASAPLAVATPPEAVTITIDETFHSSAPFVTGDITAAGGVFGAQTTGTLASVAFKPVGWAVKLPLRDHLFVYTATDEYTFSGGTFRINFEASCILTSIDFDTGDTIGACSGNWRVNGGTGDYTRLKGTGTFSETQDLNYLGGRHRLDHAGRDHAYRLISAAPRNGDCPSNRWRSA
jgi:hypothetical protein